MMNTQRMLHSAKILLAVLILAIAWLAPVHKATAMSNTDWYVRYWAQAYGLNPDWMWNIALCESGGDPYAYNAAGYYGVFQFDTTTFYSMRSMLNADTRLAPNLTYPDPEYGDLESNYGEADAHVAAWMIDNGYIGRWPVCG